MKNTTLWYTRCPVPTATSIAINSGALEEAFAPLGVQIQSLRASSERDMREAHFDHTTAGLFRHGGNIPPMWTRARGGDTAVIALSWVNEYQAIVALPQSGIREVKDLRGKRLGLPVRIHDQIDFFRAMALRGYQQGLATAGLALNDVELVELPIDENYIGNDAASQRGTLWSGASRARRQKAELFALVRGEIDAFYAPCSMGAYLSAMLGAHEVIQFGFCEDPSKRIGNESPATVTVDRALIRDDPAFVQRFLVEIMRAAEWAKSNIEQCAQIVAKETGVPEEWVVPAYGADFHEQLQIGLREPWIQALEAQKDFMVKHGFVKQDFSVREWIDPAPLQAAITQFKTDLSPPLRRSA
jgi:ABC-type nitrate/sulfonate/bicarbonate transport system substrate-binding protein